MSHSKASSEKDTSITSETLGFPSVRKLLDGPMIVAIFTGFLIYLSLRMQYFYFAELKLPAFNSPNFGWSFSNGFDQCLSHTRLLKWFVVLAVMLSIVFRWHARLSKLCTEKPPNCSLFSWIAIKVGIVLLVLGLLYFLLRESRNSGVKSAQEATNPGTCTWVQLSVGDVAGEKQYVGKLLLIMDHDYILRMEDDVNLFIRRDSVASARFRLDHVQPPTPSYPKLSATK